MKSLSLPPYHLFAYRGQAYGLDIETRTVLKLDPPASMALQLRLTETGGPHDQNPAHLLALLRACPDVPIVGLDTTGHQATILSTRHAPAASLAELHHLLYQVLEDSARRTFDP